MQKNIELLYCCYIFFRDTLQQDLSNNVFGAWFWLRARRL